MDVLDIHIFTDFYRQDILFFPNSIDFEKTKLHSELENGFSSCSTFQKLLSTYIIISETKLRKQTTNGK